MRALSVRQPYAELILRGVKTVEYRSRPTRVIGERFYIYAPVKRASGDVKAWSRELTVPAEPLPGWLIELAEQVRMIEPGALLPTGVIVGSAVIERCLPVQLTANYEQSAPTYAWHLTEVQRLPVPLKPSGHPQPVWFRAF
jgi:hypothetical protein